MIIFNRFSKGQTVRALVVFLCVFFFLAMMSAVVAKPRGFGNNPHGGGKVNPVGIITGTGGMKNHQHGLKMNIQSSFGKGSGHTGSGAFGGSSGNAFSGKGGSGKGGFVSSGGTQGQSRPSTIISGGFGKGCNNGSKAQKPANNVFGGKSGCLGGYSGNGMMMTKHGSDVVIRMPFKDMGKSTHKNGKFVIGCGDAYSKVFSDSDCHAGSFNAPNPIGAKGPNPHHGGRHPKKGDGNPGGGKGRGHWGEGNKGNGRGNIWTGNCGRGVGEGMCCGKKKPPHDCDSDNDIDTDIDIDIDLDNDIDMDIDTDLDNDIDMDTDDDVFVPAAPLWVKPEMEFSGCPALMQWLSAELDVPRDQIQIYMANTLATFRDINPCNMCARLQNAALTLHDREGIGLSALATVLDEIAEPGAPISPEQIMQVAQRLAEPEPGSIYELAAEYLNAAQTYVTILRQELGYSTDGSFALAAKYIGAIEDAEVADYVTAHLINLNQ